MLAKLGDYHAEHSHCRVPMKHLADPKLGRWVTTQREYKKKLDAGHPHPLITEERVRRCLCLVCFYCLRGLDTAFALCFHCLRG